MSALADFWKIASAVLGLTAAWEWGSAFGRLAMPADWARGSAEFVGCLVLFGLVTGFAILAAVPFQLAARGNTHGFVLWYAALPWRALAFAMYLALLGVVLMLWTPVVDAVWKGLGLSRPPQGVGMAVFIGASLLPLVPLVMPGVEGRISRAIKRSIARTFLPVLHFRRTLLAGRGGSAAFASILNDWRHL